MTNEQRARGLQRHLDTTCAWESDRIAAIAAAFAEVERRARTAILRRVISVVRDERLSDYPESYDDIAYNRALDHAEEAIRALSLDPAAPDPTNKESD